VRVRVSRVSVQINPVVLQTHDNPIDCNSKSELESDFRDKFPCSGLFLILTQSVELQRILGVLIWQLEIYLYCPCKLKV
jgi:hypothetical protein